MKGPHGATDPGQASVRVTNDSRTTTQTSGRVWPLYLGFAATGVGVALPGATLPAMLLRWHLTDAQGGRLFLFAWIGSSVGALAVRDSLRTALLLGCAGVVLGMTRLAFAFGSITQAYLCMACYGAGLGLTMTAISLLRQQAASQSGPELLRLNLVWALGACICPTLAERALRIDDLRPLLLGLAAVFAVLGAWVASHAQLARERAEPRVPWRWNAIRSVPAPLIAVTMLATGIEASAGGWLATYSRRSGAGVAGMIAAPTCVWIGLMLSRLVWARWSQKLTTRTILRGSVTLTAAAAILLFAQDAGPALLLAAFLLGCGIGPVYPLLLAAVLRFTRTGTIFFLAGVGSACLPWLTGVAATAGGSLRQGLLVPMVAAVAILAVVWTTPEAAWSATAQADLDGPQPG